MGLAQQQQALAKLYTDAALRERFFANPVQIGQILGLSADEAWQLAQVSAQQVKSFAHSLLNKRLHAVHKLLPLTRRGLGEQFDPLFRRYAHTYVPQGIKKHQADAIAFAAFIEQVARVDSLEPHWAAELARYEAASLVASEPACRWLMRRFHYPIGPLTRQVAHGTVSALPRQMTLMLWLRFSRRGRLRHLALSLPRWLAGNLSK